MVSDLYLRGDQLTMSDGRWRQPTPPPLFQRIFPKNCRLCVRVIINKRSVEPFMCLDLQKSTFESRKNTTASATILCPAVCISDVIHKAGMCSKDIENIIITSQIFLFFIGQERANMAASRGAQIGSKKKEKSTSIVTILTEQPNEACR